MRKLGIFINITANSYKEIFEMLNKQKCEKNIQFFIFKDQIDFIEKNYPSYIEDFEIIIPGNNELEAILVFGGDGTILRAIHHSLNFDTPIIGINLGHLGFLTDINLNEFDSFIDILLSKKYNIQERMLIKVCLKRNDKIIKSYKALNDAVIDRGNTSKLITVDYYVNESFVLETRCDGMLISTPTGSTAYSLAAGGPILSPTLDAIIVNPLNPHILSVRPMVFKKSDCLNFRMSKTYQDSSLHVDGVHKDILQKEDEILITANEKKLKFIKFTDRDFFKILRKKLHMGRK